MAEALVPKTIWSCRQKLRTARWKQDIDCYHVRASRPACKGCRGPIGYERKDK